MFEITTNRSRKVLILLLTFQNALTHRNIGICVIILSHIPATYIVVNDRNINLTHTVNWNIERSQMLVLLKQFFVGFDPSWKTHTIDSFFVSDSYAYIQDSPPMEILYMVFDAPPLYFFLAPINTGLFS